MTPTSLRQWSDTLALQICSAVDKGNFNKATVAEQLQKNLIEILQVENTELLNELTNLACKEMDSTRRAFYFKLARMVQGRIPKKAAAASEVPASSAPAEVHS